MTCFRFSLFHKGWYGNLSQDYWISWSLPSYSPILEAATFGARSLSPSSQRGDMAFYTEFTVSRLQSHPIWNQLHVQHTNLGHRNERELWNFAKATNARARHARPCWWSLETVGGLRGKDIGGNSVKPFGNSNRTEWKSNARHKAACNQTEKFYSSQLQVRSRSCCVLQLCLLKSLKFEGFF